MTHMAGVAPITREQAQLVRELFAASVAAQEKLSVVVTALSAGHVPPGATLHSILDTELHFLVPVSDAE